MEGTAVLLCPPWSGFPFFSACNSVCQSGDKITKHSYEAAFVGFFFFFFSCHIVAHASTTLLNSIVLAEWQMLPFIASLKSLIQ